VISVANQATSKLVQFLVAPGGLNAAIAAVAQAESVDLAPVPTQQIFTENVSSDIAEKSDKIMNTLNEKFRKFSGTLQLEVDVRVSQDRLEGIDRISQLYTDAVTQTLSQVRGDWGQGLFYTGTYEISFGPVKHGGRNFIKSAKVLLQVNASIG
jgi:hypothetical protein